MIGRDQSHRGLGSGMWSSPSAVSLAVDPDVDVFGIACRARIAKCAEENDGPAPDRGGGVMQAAFRQYGGPGTAQQRGGIAESGRRHLSRQR